MNNELIEQVKLCEELDYEFSTIDNLLMEQLKYWESLRATRDTVANQEISSLNRLWYSINKYWMNKDHVSRKTIDTNNEFLNLFINYWNKNPIYDKQNYPYVIFESFSDLKDIFLKNKNIKDYLCKLCNLNNDYLIDKMLKNNYPVIIRLLDKNFNINKGINYDKYERKLQEYNNSLLNEFLFGGIANNEFIADDKIHIDIFPFHVWTDSSKINILLKDKNITRAILYLPKDIKNWNIYIKSK